MKRKHKHSKNVAKGAPSGFVISLMVHAAAFMLAGLLVVFTVHQKEEKKFIPPKPVDRPKMQLKKPRMQVKKSAKPRSTTRIVTKVKRASMPDIQLPEMSGMGDGLEVGGIGFDILPDLTELSSPFGASFTTGSDLQGHFYNFNRSRSGRKIPMSPSQLQEIIHDYMKGDWRKSILSRYYRSPNKLYTSVICIPTMMSELAPTAFGEENVEGYCWAVLYEGELVYPEDITFRFWGVSDKFMGVSVDDETVLFCAYQNYVRVAFGDVWQSKDPKDMAYYFAESRARPSDWITLKAGVPKNIKVIMGDLDGGLVYHILSVEVRGETYPLDRTAGGPTFPVFRTSEISQDVQDEIYSNLYPGDATLTNGPIFRDYISETSEAESSVTPEPQPLEVVKTVDKMRLWTALNGKTVEAEFKMMMGSDVVLENKKGRQIKFAESQLSLEDQDYLQLINPPDFSINWMNKSEQISNPPAPPWSGGISRPLRMFNFTFGVKIQPKSSSKTYNHDLKVEYFAIGDEIDGNNYVLLDYQSGHFNPANFWDKEFLLSGDPVKLQSMAYRGTAPVRGTRYGGYLVVITDPRGEVLEYKASHEFLYEKLDKLRKLRPNNHFNRDVERVIPARPTEDSRGSGATSFSI
ncbi:MAG: hypothetical protein V5783_11735 [Pontiella sp.]